MNTQHKQDLIDRFTYCIECYESVLDDDPADVWFSSEPLISAIAEAVALLEKGTTSTTGNTVTKITYSKIEVRSYETYERKAVLYR